MTEEKEVEDAEIIDEAAETATDPDKVQYEIIEGDVEGVKVRAVTANGNVLFTVTEDFTDDQIQIVFNLGNKFFNDGIRFSNGQQEQRVSQGMAMLGMTPKIIKQFYDIAVEMELKQAASEAENKTPETDVETSTDVEKAA